MKKILYVLLISLLIVQNAAGQPVPVKNEPRHRPVLENDFVRIIDAVIPHGDTSLFHIHEIPSVFVYLSTANGMAQIPGGEPYPSRALNGKTWYNAFSGKPFIHRIWNPDTATIHAIDIEILAPLPKFPMPALALPGLELVADSARARIYALNLLPRQAFRLPAYVDPFVLVTCSGSLDVGSDDGNEMLTAGHFKWVPLNKALLLRNPRNETVRCYLYEILQ